MPKSKPPRLRKGDIVQIAAGTKWQHWYGHSLLDHQCSRDTWGYQTQARVMGPSVKGYVNLCVTSAPMQPVGAFAISGLTRIPPADQP